MNNIVEYIDSISYNQKQICTFLHRLLTDDFLLDCKIRWSVPSYTQNGLICYLNCLENDQFEIAFFQGIKLSNQHGLLKSVNRKQVAGITIQSLETIPIDAVTETLNEAILLNEQPK